MRFAFQTELIHHGFAIEGAQIVRDKLIVYFLFLRTSFEQLEAAAERLKFEMPVRDLPEDCEAGTSWWDRVKARIKTDNEQDYIGTEFNRSYRDIFLGIEDEDTFFRSALRQSICWDIVSRIDISHKMNQAGDAETQQHHFEGILHLLHKKVFTEAFVPHDPVTSEKTDPRSQIAGAYGSWFRYVSGPCVCMCVSVGGGGGE